MPDIVVSQVFRNNEFLIWVKKEFETVDERTAAIMAFTWMKGRYPEIIPIVRGDLISEDKQEVHHGDL
jgi:hypothetical protein